MSFKAKIISWFGTLGKFLAVLFKEALNRELSIVLPIARQTVAAVAADPSIVSSTDKRNAAIAKILSQLTEKQTSVGQDVIRLAIELAYQDFKDSSNMVVINNATN